jgi:predicted DCC family thiol-disulfide oxidoreductase YuxK
MRPVEQVEKDSANSARASPPDPVPIVYFDGHCGMCHATVRFVIRHDPVGNVARFAPLGGETFLSRVPEHMRHGLPDSMIAHLPDGRLLTRSAAVLYLLVRMGGLWGVLGRIGGWIPTALLDLLYRAVARIRHRVRKPPETACPILPPQFKGRFLP